MLTRMIDNKGVTLIESLISILLLSILITSVMGAYYLSLSAVNRGKHVAIANSILNSYMDREMQAGYTGGGSPGESYYATVNMSTGGFVHETIDGVVYNVTCSPWYPDNIQTPSGDAFMFDGRYKKVGFNVSWSEQTPTARQSNTYSVRAASYVFQH